MSKAIQNLRAAQQRAMAIRPKVGGFPLSGSGAAQGRHYAEHPLLAGLSESLSDEGWAGGSARDAALVLADAWLIQRLIISRLPVLIREGIPLFGLLPRDIRSGRSRHVPIQAAWSKVSTGPVPEQAKGQNLS